jgi:hypothetical protein
MEVYMTRRATSLMQCAVSLALVVVASSPVPRAAGGDSVLANHLLVTWYGNPHSSRMGVLGQKTGTARADALRQQGLAYQALTKKKVLMAYHLVAVVAQAAPGADGMYRRRESAAVIRALLDEARANGFRLVLDIQPGRSSVRAEVAALRPFLEEPDVDLALDPEFALYEPDVPGRKIGAIRAADINAALDLLEQIIVAEDLPAKVLIVHQFRSDMLPDKAKVRSSALVDIVLNMDGFGSQTLKLSTYRAIDRQGRFAFAGFKLFYDQDSQLYSPAQVMSLSPVPSVVIYQ